MSNSKTCKNEKFKSMLIKAFEIIIAEEIEALQSQEKLIKNFCPSSNFEIKMEALIKSLRTSD